LVAEWGTPKKKYLKKNMQPNLFNLTQKWKNFYQFFQVTFVELLWLGVQMGLKTLTPPTKEKIIKVERKY
jgi:hypothetical protein